MTKRMPVHIYGPEGDPARLAFDLLSPDPRWHAREVSHRGSPGTFKPSESAALLFGLDPNDTYEKSDKIQIVLAPKITPSHASDFTIGVRPGAREADLRHLGADEFFDSGEHLIENVVRKAGEFFLRPRPAHVRLDPAIFDGPFALPFAEVWTLFQFLLRRLDVEILAINKSSLEYPVACAAALAHRYVHDV